MDLKEYNENKNWNIEGFQEVDKVMDLFKDFADQNNKMGSFRMKLKETEKTVRGIIIIELEK